ncbi:MAG: metallophosphoesterase [Opitutaceae bacterium]|nr:metallophosphoesterase [Opitutaceae bacterium]
MNAKTHMERRSFVKLIGAAGTLAAAGGATTLARAAETPGKNDGAAAARPLVDGTPAVFAPTSRSATIVWTVNGAALGWVEYGTSADRLDMRSGGDADGFTPHDERVLKIRLTGLAAGTRYWWRCMTRALTASGDEAPPVASRVYSFSTLAPEAAETRFVIWNDTHDREETLVRLAGLTQDGDAPPADFLMWNGDIVRGNNTDASMIPGVYVHPRGGVDLAKGPPVLLTRGNHDVRGLWASKVGGFIDFPDTHEGGARRPFHAFRSGPLGAIVLDTGEDKPDRHPSFRGTAAFEPLIAEQARWLEKVIARPDIKDAPVKVVFCHIPLRWTDEKPQDYFAKPAGFDRFSKRGRDAWHDSLVKWGARVIISAHVHRWTHIPADSAFPYAQITGGGTAPEAARLIRGHATAAGLMLDVLDMNGRKTDTVRF